MHSDLTGDSTQGGSCDFWLFRTNMSSSNHSGYRTTISRPYWIDRCETGQTYFDNLLSPGMSVRLAMQSPGPGFRNFRVELRELGNTINCPRTFLSIADFKMLCLSEFWELCAQISHGNQHKVKVMFFCSFKPICLL